MKRALIAIASVGILAPTVWVVTANAQYGSPPPPRGSTVYTPGSGPPPYGVPAQTYARQSEGPWEWHAGPGPSKRAGGTMCVKHTDAGRGYGYQEPCPPPKKAAKK
jgi:hypothetical protein